MNGKKYTKFLTLVSWLLRLQLMFMFFSIFKIAIVIFKIMNVSTSLGRNTVKSQLGKVIRIFNCLRCDDGIVVI